jgi:GNAT superfamily N-acetyltransferase
VNYGTIHLQENPTLIPLIAQWYDHEWLIPTETSTGSLKEKLNKTIPLQIVLFLDEIPVATGGIYEKVGLLDVEPRFKQYGPWLALMYTVPSFRGRGVGTHLCQKTGRRSNKAGINKILPLYVRCRKVLLKTRVENIREYSV